MRASRAIGSSRSATVPSSAMATVRLASDLAMPSTTARPVVPAAISRVLPSGKVRIGMDHESPGSVLHTRQVSGFGGAAV